MTEKRDLFPETVPEEKSRRGGLRYRDSRGRLVAWSVRQGDYLLFYQVKSWRRITQADGKKLEVPEAVVSTWTDRELDPNHELGERHAVGLSDGQGYQHPAREFDEDDLQHSCARYFNATTCRWISEEPLGYEAGDSDRYPYVKPQS